MILVENVLGNRADEKWAEILKTAQVDLFILEQWEATKNRIRKFSEQERELAVSLPRNVSLHDGDVLFFDEDANTVVLASVAMKDVLVIELKDLEGLSHTELLRVCFELGHGLGNQHWPAVIKGTSVYVPLSVDQKVMASVLRTHAFSHINSYFMAGKDVLPLLDAKEIRLMFGGAEGTAHTHSHMIHNVSETLAQGHDHSHGDHGHEHSHGDHSHSHDHSHDHNHSH